MGTSVDIVLPTHKRPHTVTYSIQSVLHQTHEDWRLHVIGDGCDAATESLVRGCDDGRIQFHRFVKGHGYGYAHRNVVLRGGEAPYIAYITDDDLWFPDHLERGISALVQSDLGLVAFRSCHVKYPDRLDPYFFSFDWRNRLCSSWLRHWVMGSVELVHRRTVFDVAGYWNEDLFRFGDREFYNRVRLSAVPSAYVDIPTVLRFYAQHWDQRYAGIAEPPQRRYVTKLQDPEWCNAVRAATLEGRRDLSVRWQQWRDCLSFGLGYGPKFVRFWWERPRRRLQQGVDDNGSSQRSAANRS